MSAGRILRPIGRLFQSKLFWLALVAIAIIVAIAQIGDDEASGIPLDPADVGPLGSRAAVLTLEELGMTVDTGTEPKGDVVVVLVDLLSQEQRDAVDDFVKAGGTLVLADPSSPLGEAQAVDDALISPTTLTARCDRNWVRGVDAIAPSTERTYPVLQAPSDGSECFRATDGAFVVEYPNEFGTVIQLGTPVIFSNEQIGKEDNAVLLANLVGADNGGTITLLQPDLEAPIESAGDDGLGDLIPQWVTAIFWQAGIAMVFFALWRGRRLGKPVVETQPVELPASALILAVGELFAQAGQTNAAANILRRDLHRRLCELMGVPFTTPPPALAAMVADRTGIDEARLAMALRDAHIGDSASLLAIAQSIEDVHREVANAR